jgi:O-antigen/teichoic acid export membrane protein
MAQPESSDRESFLARLHGRLRPHANFMIAGESLKAKVFRGGAWIGTWTVGAQVLRFVRNIVLTRLLAPEVFGMMAIVLSAASIFHTMTDIGVKEALVQNPRGTEERYTNAAWWLTLGRSLLLYLVAFASAPWVSRFYGNPELAPLLRVAFVAVIFDGVLSSRAYVAMKEMKFGKWAAINHGGGILGIIITLVLILFIRNIWALVIGSVAESAGSCILSYILCPHVPSFSWDAEAFRDLLRFAKGLIGLSFLNFIFARTDVFVLAKLFSPVALGLYVMAVYLAQTPSSLVMNLFGQTLLPTFAQIQDNPQRTSRILLQITSATLLIGMPIVVFILFSGTSILKVFYGQRYGIASASFMVASSVALLNIVNGQITTVFYARGLPRLHRRCVFIMSVTMIVLIYPFVKWFGLVGGQLAALVSIGAGFLFQVARIRDLIGLNLARYGRAFLLSAGISLIVAAVYLVARPFVVFAKPLNNILIGAAGCLVACSFSLMSILQSREKEAV